MSFIVLLFILIVGLFCVLKFTDSILDLDNTPKVITFVKSTIKSIVSMFSKDSDKKK